MQNAVAPTEIELSDESASDSTHRVLVLCHDMSDNVVSRAMVLSELAVANGWEVRVAGPSSRGLWAGVTEAFSKRCTELPSNPVAMVRACTPLVRWATCVISCKTYPTSFALARILTRRLDRPLVVDIDDFDAEHYLNRGWSGFGSVLFGSNPKRIARDLTGMHNPLVARSLRNATAHYERMVSSLALQRSYGGTFIPSAREEFFATAPHVSDRPVVGFLGTVRPHKGVDKLREAIEQLSPQGFSLVVTAGAPDDAKPWETWTGPVSYQRIRELLTEVDIVAVPSSESGATAALAAGQLSIKLLDAMAAGRACVVGDTEPLRWGLSGTGRVIEGDSVDDLVKALLPLRDPLLRAQLGSAAKERALEHFSLRAVAPAFAQVVGSMASARPSDHSRA